MLSDFLTSFSVLMLCDLYILHVDTACYSKTSCVLLCEWTFFSLDQLRINYTQMAWLQSVFVFIPDLSESGYWSFVLIRNLVNLLNILKFCQHLFPLVCVYFVIYCQY